MFELLESKHLTQVQSPTAPASLRGGCARGRQPCAVPAERVAVGSTVRPPHAAWVARPLFRPSAPDPCGWARHAPRGRSPSSRASEAATRSATCLPSVWQSAALQGPPRSLASSNFVSALSSRPLRMGSARAPWSLTIQSGLGRCYEVSYTLSYVPAHRMPVRSTARPPTQLG